MRTASELLGSDRNALVPLSATLVARPVRLCVFVPLHSEVPWEASVEHALASQARYWGGHANLVVPLFDGLGADEVFWRVIRQYDLDVIALHQPTVGDVEEMAPDLHERAMSGLRSSLADAGFAMASEAGAQIQLKTDATIGKGKLDIADVKGKLELITSTDTEFVSVPRGKSGTTPLYRILHYHPDRPGHVPDWFPWPRGGHHVEFAYAKRITENVALYPAPEALRSAEALRFGD